MPGEDRKVSSRELLGTAFPEREVREVPSEKVAIHVYSIGPNQQRENLTGGQPIEGYLDREDLEKQFGVGRYLLVAKNKDTGTVITQATVDVVRTAPHPLAVREEEEEQAQIGKRDEAFDVLLQKLEDLERRIDRPQRPALEVEGSNLTEKLLLRFLDEKADEKKSMAEQMSLIVRNALEAQKAAMKSASDFELLEKQDQLEMRRMERQRKWEREDMEFEAKARLVAQRMANISGASITDPEGGNTMSLVEAIKDIIGADESFRVFGFDLGNLIEPIVPQLAKALEDRGLFILTKPQLEQIISSQFERGRLQGQEEAFSELTTSTESKDGQDGGPDQRGIEDNPGPDNRTGGKEGG